MATITLQNFYKLYKKLAGMTGTAMTESNEFWKIYNLEVVAIPTNRALKRINYPDVVFRTEREKWKAIIDEIVEYHKKGQPILVGTTDVAKSEKLGDMLKRKGIKFELLNAKPEYAAREAEIVAQAGRIGAVTISTNMAGRGTDIILGGNPEFMAWAQLKNQFATRLDVPPDTWKATVDAIEAKEKTKEEGRKVADLGGLHIIGTERHEARRIDNQLRGRAGRQGDPGSSRFFLSLQDDLMRIFAGEWVSAVLTRMGMQEGEAIESGMVSRRIEAAQKKVEERNFDIRKHLLDYDEVMDHQRKRVYGFRQDILEGVNGKLLILDMLEDQIDATVDRCVDEKYGIESFVQYAALRLGAEFEPADFYRADFETAQQVAREKALRQAENQLQDALEENLDPDTEQREWNWEALVNFLTSRWQLKTNARELRQIGRDHLVEHFLPKIEEAIAKVGLEDGAPMLAPDFGRKAICDWVRLKFQASVTPAELEGKDPRTIKGLLFDLVRRLYREKEAVFPVQVGLANFMAEAGRGGMRRYDRDGLYAWAKDRFGAAAANLSQDDFRTQPRNQLAEILEGVAKQFYPADGQDQIDAELDVVFGTSEYLSAEQAKALAAWAEQKLQLKIEPERLTNLSEKSARQALSNVYDLRYRPEMRAMERSLLLNILDASWKDHLYAMDHLRAGIGLVGYGQIDPKTEFKRQGMKVFEEMWDGIQVKVTDLVFRMEEAADSFAEALMSSAVATKAEVERPAAPAPAAGGDGIRAQQDQAIAGSQQAAKKVDPIRNRRPNVGRNDPCPCGSGKKYKNCHMKTAG